MNKKKVVLAFIFLMTFVVLLGVSLVFYGKFYEKANAEKIPTLLADRPDDALLNFRLGAEKYKAKDFSVAQQLFDKAVLGSKENGLTDLLFKSTMGSGNSRYRLAKKLVDAKELGQGGREEAIKSLEEAIENYGVAVSMDPEKQEPVVNREFAKALLEKLQKKEEDQKDQKPENNPSQDQKNDGDSDSRGQDREENPDQNNNKKEPGDDKQPNASGQKNDDKSGSEGAEKGDQDKHQASSLEQGEGQQNESQERNDQDPQKQEGENDRSSAEENNQHEQGEEKPSPESSGGLTKELEQEGVDRQLDESEQEGGVDNGKTANEQESQDMAASSLAKFAKQDIDGKLDELEKSEASLNTQRIRARVKGDRNQAGW